MVFYWTIFRFIYVISIFKNSENQILNNLITKEKRV